MNNEGFLSFALNLIFVEMLIMIHENYSTQNPLPNS